MNVTKLLGLAAVGAMLILAAPTAQALSLANPGAAVAVQQDSKVEATQVHWRRGGHRHHCHHCRW
jgi:hypothetical protein